MEVCDDDTNTCHLSRCLLPPDFEATLPAEDKTATALSYVPLGQEALTSCKNGLILVGNRSPQRSVKFACALTREGNRPNSVELVATDGSLLDDAQCKHGQRNETTKLVTIKFLVRDHPDHANQ